MRDRGVGLRRSIPRDPGSPPSLARRLRPGTQVESGQRYSTAPARPKARSRPTDAIATSPTHPSLLSRTSCAARRSGDRVVGLRRSIRRDPGSPPSLTRRLRPGTQVDAVIRDLSRQISDGRRPWLGALLAQRLAGDSDFGFGFFRDLDIASGRDLHGPRAKPMRSSSDVSIRNERASSTSPASGHLAVGCGISCGSCMAWR